MSCGGEALLGGCGCGPGVNNHESYKGDWSGSSAKNYSTNSRYVGQDTPLPKTAMTRSYAAERLYVGKTFERIAERIYDAPTFTLSSAAPLELVPGRFDIRAPESNTQTTTKRLQQSLGTSTYAAQPYNKSSSIKELSTLAEVYNKQRLLESKISEAFKSNSIDKLVNQWTN